MPTFMSRATAVSDGANTLFSIPFPYLQPQHVVVQVRSSESALPVTLVQGVDYTFGSLSVINLTTPQPEGYFVDRLRQSGLDAPLIPFGGGTLTNAELQTNNLQMLYLVQEAEDLALFLSGGGTVITDPGDGGGDGGTGLTITTPRYGFMTGTAPPFANLLIDAQGHLGEGFERHLWLDMFYTDDTTTDSQALLNFAALFNAGTIADCTLHMVSTKGRGPAGRYIIDQEILFTGGSRLVLDFHEATVRWTTPTARIHYKAPQVTGSSSITPISFFVVRNVICQYAAAIDCLFYWDFQYINSRDMGTGYIENARVYPQDNLNAGHTTVSTFRTKNTWYWSADRVHAKGPPRTVGNFVAGNSFLHQEGLCVVTLITRCELEFYDAAIIPGQCPLVGVNGTFAGGASFTRGKGIRQGANVGWFGRNDSYGGNGTYSLYDVVGTLVDGVCEVLGTDGTVTAGSFTITGAITPFTQLSEAITVTDGTTIINGNYAINAASPTPTTLKFLDWNFENVHCNVAISAIKANGLAGLTFTGGSISQVLAGGTTFLDITNGDFISVQALEYTSNDLPNCTVFKGRNISSGMFSNNTIYLAKYAVDLDNTVKSFKVHGNTGYEVTTGNNPTLPTFLNTGNRYNAVNARGIDFKSNGRMGRGFDTDDNHMLSWAPVPTAQRGESLTYTTTPGGGININNGVLHLHAKFTLTALGGAGAAGNNAMYISFPASSLAAEFGVPTSALVDFLVSARVSNAPVSAVYDSANSRILIANADPFNNPGGNDNAFRANDTALTGPVVVILQASVPIQYD